MRTGTADRPVHADDAAIIEASHANPEAFAELFDRHAPVIHRYIARRIGPQIAEDVAAETFLAAFRRRSRYETQQADARPWLYGIAGTNHGNCGCATWPCRRCRPSSRRS